MSRLPRDIDPDDVAQWLHNCWFQAYGKPLKYHTYRMGEVIGISYPSGVTVRVDLEDVEVIWPYAGAINIEDIGALYVQRMPRRQWRRSYSPREMHLIVPHEEDMRAKFPESPLWEMRGSSWQLVHAVIDPFYPTWAEAMRLLRDLPSVALNRHLLVMGGGVYYRGDRVGMLDGEVFNPQAESRIARRVGKMIGALRNDGNP